MAPWRSLAAHAEPARAWSLADLLDSEGRFADFSLACGEDGDARLFLDFSRQRATRETLRLLAELARSRRLDECRAALFKGEVVNLSEGRPALHTDARSPSPQAPALARERERISRFAARFRRAELPGAAGRPLSRVVNIGIGGSDLGVRLLCSALAEEGAAPVEFVSEMDGVELQGALNRTPPEETLFVVCSKSFRTVETLANAYSARHWLVSHLGGDAPARHFAGVSSNAEAMSGWGIAPELQFGIPPGIGGRYSVWSAAALSAWLCLGRRRMGEFLSGGAGLDRHFLNAPAERSLPVLMALFALWNQSLLGCSAHLLLPYDTRLGLLPAYLQQLELESLGKSADAQGRPLPVDGVAAQMGACGSSAQHSIMQWAQQGARNVCADFIAVRDAAGAYPQMRAESHRQMTAQAEALARGLRAEAMASDPLAAHKALPGGRSSNVLLLETLDARHLGALIALYEHKVFVHAALLGVNPFDQWGVEHAKRLAANQVLQPPLAALLDD